MKLSLIHLTPAEAAFVSSVVGTAADNEADKRGDWDDVMIGSANSLCERWVAAEDAGRPELEIHGLGELEVFLRYVDACKDSEYCGGDEIEGQPTDQPWTDAATRRFEKLVEQVVTAVTLAVRNHNGLIAIERMQA